MQPRQPIPGSDQGEWGVILNEYLSVSLSDDGALKTEALTLAGGYVKPLTGIPSTDLSSETQDSIDAAVRVGGDLGGTTTTPTVVATHLDQPLPISQGGTGSTTKNFVDLTSAQSVTNKTLVQRVVTLNAVSNTYTPDSSNADLIRITSPTGSFTIANDSGSPTDGQKLILRIRSGATPYVPTWANGYMSSGVATLPTTLVASKTVTCGFVYDSAVTKWVLMAVDAIGY